MAQSKKSIDAVVKRAEAKIADRLREVHTTQTFDGTLKVRLDRIYVAKEDGVRVLTHLRQLKSGKGN